MYKFLTLIAMAAVLLCSARGRDAASDESESKRSSGLEELVREARDLFEMGRYGEADQKCRSVLAFDHHNKQALDGRELIKRARAELAVRPVDKNRYSNAVVYPQICWELPGDPGTSPVEKAHREQASRLIAGLSAMIIPSVDFRGTALRDAVAWLSEASRTVDADGKVSHVTIDLQFSAASTTTKLLGDLAAPPDSNSDATLATGGSVAESPAEPDIPGLPSGAVPQPQTSGETPVEFTATNVSVYKALESVGCKVALKVKVDPDKVSLVPYDAVLDEPLITISVRVPPSFIVGPDTAGGGSEVDAKKFCESSGVTFPPGAKAIYIKRTSELVVRDTQPNIDLVQALVY